MLKQYDGLLAAVRTYWRDYGGWSDLIRSPMFHAATLISLAQALGLLSIEWRDLTIGMMPTILGFSLAAYAITFSLMGTKLHVALSNATDGVGRPLAISVNATLFHNVFIQVLSLIFAVVTNGTLLSKWIYSTSLASSAKSTLVYRQAAVGDVLGTFLLVYAVILLLSSGLAMFRLGRLNPAERPRVLPANDARKPEERVATAKELYGFRWSIVRMVARILRVKG